MRTAYLVPNSIINLYFFKDKKCSIDSFIANENMDRRVMSFNIKMILKDRAFSFYNRGRYKAPSQFKIALFSQIGRKKFTISKEISQISGILSSKYFTLREKT
jgi:hypothetical protein